MQSGMPFPDFIRNAPELQEGLEFYLAAFYDLSSTRPCGFGPGCLSIINVIQYGQLLGLSDDEIDDLWYFTRQLDNVYLKWHAEKGEASS